jgi:putative FmdB family regulatory protein
MPIYEFRCRDCRRRVQILTLRVSEKIDAVCEHCGGRHLDRLMSRFAMARSEESRLESLADPSGMSDVDESDPRSVARWMRRMGRELGDDASGPEFDEMVDELESAGDGTGNGEGGDDGAEPGDGAD